MEDGIATMGRLAQGVLDALTAVGLVDVRADVQRRILQRPALEMCEQNGEGQWMYRPMVELALREIQSLATKPHTSNADRRARIRQVFILAGITDPAT